MRKPAVILATGNASAIAARRPDAFVVDHVGIRVLHGSEQIVLGRRGFRTVLFTVASAVLCAADGFVEYDDLWQPVYGDDPDGGPLNPGHGWHMHIYVLRPFFAWAGLAVSTLDRRRRCESVWLGERVPARRPLVIVHPGVRGPARFRAFEQDCLEAAA